MSCEQTAELLPWWLNGTLDEAEAQQIRTHLETCDACREELRQTRLAWSLAEGHLPAEALVDHAMGRPLTAGQQQLVEQHLATCARCREELELLTDSPPRETAVPSRVPDLETTAPAWRGSRRGFRHAALAAAAAVLVATAGWLWNMGVGERRRAEELEARIAELSAPRLNIPIFELLPSSDEAVLRSTAPTAGPIHEITRPTDATVILLTLLSTETDRETDYTIEVLNDHGDLTWRRDGLTRSSDGHFTLALPADFLPPGRSTIQIARSDDPERIVRYELRTVAPKP